MIRLLHDFESSGFVAPEAPRTLVVAISGVEGEDRARLVAEMATLKALSVKVIDAQPGSADRPYGGPDPDVVMTLLASPDGGNWRRQLKEQRQSALHACVMALVAESTPEAWRAALRAGADDVLEMPPAGDELERALLKASERRAHGERSLDKIICSLVSVCGGAGVTQLAVNLAFTIQHLFSEKQVAAVDLDLQAGALAVMLDLEPEHTILELADPTSVIDSIRMEAVLCKHESGLLLLAAPKRIADCELVTVSAVEAALRVLREICAVVLVDCGTHVNEASVSAWEHSDYLLYVIEQSVTAVRSALRFQDLYRSLELNVQPSYVLNQYSPDRPVTPQQIEAVLQQPLFATIPRDDKACAEIQVSGQSVWKISAGAELRTSLEALTRKLLLPDGEESVCKPGLLARLRAAFGG